MWYLRRGSNQPSGANDRRIVVGGQHVREPHQSLRDEEYIPQLDHTRDTRPTPRSSLSKRPSRGREKESACGGLQPYTFCLVTNPVNESRITRRRPRFDIQVDPVNVLSDDRDPRCTVVQTPVRIRGGTENTHLAYEYTLFKVPPGVGGPPKITKKTPICRKLTRPKLHLRTVSCPKIPQGTDPKPYPRTPPPGRPK